jgi:hypothetical protein
VLLRRHAPELRYDLGEDIEDQAADAFTNHYTTLGTDPDGHPIYIASDQYVNTLKEPGADPGNGGYGILAAAGSPGPGVGMPHPLVLGILSERYWFGPTDQQQPAAQAEAFVDARDNDTDTYRQDANTQRQAGFDHRIYARATHDNQGNIWLQYWSFYYYNAYSTIVGGVHEGDWEMIQIRLNEALLPDRVTFAEHSYGQSCAWSHVEKLATSASTPIVYVAADSHASYLRSGQTAIDVDGLPDLATDQHHGDGNRVQPELEVIAETTPRWVSWPGTWGASIDGDFRSPRTPSQQRPWTDPAGFDTDNRRPDRPCG